MVSHNKLQQRKSFKNKKNQKTYARNKPSNKMVELVHARI